MFMTETAESNLKKNVSLIKYLVPKFKLFKTSGLNYV